MQGVAQGGRADPIGGDVAGGELEAAKEVVLDELVEVDEALINVDGGIYDLQPQLLLHLLYALRAHLHQPTQPLNLRSMSLVQAIKLSPVRS